MAAQVLTDLTAAVTKITEVVPSAVAALNGIGARLQSAVDKALENGATADELAPVQAEVDALNANSTALAEAVAANTDAA